eukprot:1003448-Amphidinium_carterae.1
MVRIKAHAATPLLIASYHLTVQEAWQKGSCQGSMAGARCPRNPELAHQCSRCLSSEHGGA